MLLEHGAMVDCADWDQRTALRAAAWGGHEDIVKALLQHGADVNRTDDEGRTALIAAAYMGHSEIVEHLLDFGAEIDHADNDGRTALSVAALCVPSNHGYAKVSFRSPRFHGCRKIKKGNDVMGQARTTYLQDLSLHRTLLEHEYCFFSYVLTTKF